MARELTCQEMVELVTDYLEDRPGSGRAPPFEAHLVVCDGCQASHERLRETLGGT